MKESERKHEKRNYTHLTHKETNKKKKTNDSCYSVQHPGKQKYKSVWCIFSFFKHHHVESLAIHCFSPPFDRIDKSTFFFGMRTETHKKRGG